MKTLSHTIGNTVLQPAAFTGEHAVTTPSTTIRPLAKPAHWAFFKYITKITGIALNEAEKQTIVGCGKIKKLRKRQYLLQEGDVCKYNGFIVSGAMRMFSVNERGQESVISFGLENDWIADHESFKKAKSSPYHIEATEDTELLLFTCEQLTMLAGNIPAIDQMNRAADSEQLIFTQNRVHAALSMTAEERYYNLLQAYPQYPQRFPQNMIACFLGIKPETLSRIRKR